MNFEDRREEYADAYWRQGCLLMTRTVRQMSPEWQAEAAAIEKRLVFTHFSDRDDGRSRVLVYACETAKEAADMVRAHNHAVYIALQKKLFRESIRHRSF